MDSSHHHPSVSSEIKYFFLNGQLYSYTDTDEQQIQNVRPLPSSLASTSSAAAAIQSDSESDCDCSECKAGCPVLRARENGGGSKAIDGKADQIDLPINKPEDIISLSSSPESIPEAKGTAGPSLPSSPTGQPMVNPSELPQYDQLLWNCPFEPACAQTFDSKASINAHLFEVHDCLPFRCLVSTCTASFDNRTELGTHIKSAHSDMTTYPCAKCSKIYSSYTKLGYHNSRLHVTGLFRCTYPNCTQICTTRIQSSHHYFKHKPVPSVVCSICNKTLKRRNHLRDHLLTHTDNRQTYQCTTCQVSFSTKGALKVHTRVHSAARPYTCSVCTKSFTQQSHLKEHEETHLPATVPCDHCNKQFRGQYSLKHHLSHSKCKQAKES